MMATTYEPICGEIHWKEKYLQMEAKMSQFHIQASDIRNKLAVKISSLTDECDAANSRADKAEEELRLLKEKLRLREDEKDKHITQLQEDLLKEKENAAKHEESLKQEIEERNEERALVHEKIVRLKGWISTRLEEAEDQKKLLFEANERATTSLIEMKRRVQELTAELNDMKQMSETPSTMQAGSAFDLSLSTTTLSTSYSMDISCSPPVPPHTDRSLKIPPRPSRGNGYPSAKDYRLPSPVLPDDSLHHDTSSSATSETISHVSSIEDTRKDAKVVTRMPQVEIEDIVIENSEFLDKRDIFSTSPKSAVDGKKKKKSATLPKTRSLSKKDSTSHHSSLIETFGSITRKFRGFTDSSHQGSPTRSLRRTQSAGKKEGKLVRSDSGSKKHGSTPHLAKELLKTPKLKSRSSGKSKQRLSDTLEEEEDKLQNSEKMELSENNSAPSSTYLLSTSLPSPMLSSILPKTKRSQSMRTPRKGPPPPPLHRVPVWETKIYNLAKTGFELRGNDVIRSSYHDTYVPVRYHSPEEKTNSIYTRGLPNVPVYTKLFGKFVLLRKTAFSDSAERSDDEDDAGTLVIDHAHHRSLPLYDFSTIPLRRHNSPCQARAIKRANSSHSVTSSEGDYSIPPDALSLCSDSSEPEHKLYKTCRTGAPAAASSRVNSSSSASPESGTSPLLSPSGTIPNSAMDKGGFLNKLSGFSLTWKKRWFVLKPNKLQYFLSPNDVNRKPSGEIQLNNETKLGFEHETDPQPVFHIYNGKKTIYFSAESTYICDDWMRAISIVLNRPRIIGIGKIGRYRSIAQNDIALKGWVERSSKDGKKRKLWACLGTSSLYFYTDEDKQEFVGRMILKDCKIIPMDEETVISVKFPLHHGQQRGDVFLTVANKMEKDAWLYWLTVASGSLSLSLSGPHNSDSAVGTAFERLVTRIMYVAMCTSDNKEESVSVGASSPLWRDPIFSFSRDGGPHILTTLSSDALYREAVKLVKICQQYMNSEIDSTSIDFHVTLAQEIASRCLNHQQLQGEMYAQLIKQCNGKFSKPAAITMSPKNKMKTSKTDDETASLQIWKLLSLLIPLFLPNQRMLWLLTAHLHRHADDKSEIGQYAMYCQRAMRRLLTCGGRTSPPSRTETVSILLQNPFHHSLPFSVPVHFHNGDYQVVSFDASTTVSEFTLRVCQESGIRVPSISGFSLFTDDPSDLPLLEHYISKTSKVCDVISEWEKTCRDLTAHKVVDTSRMVKITLSQHLSFVSGAECETDKEKNLILYQVASMISSDHFPVSRELAIELTALCAQIDEGDLRSADHTIKEVLEKFYPKRYLDSTSKQHIRQLRGKLCERWTMLKQATECPRVFLTAVRNCLIYGSKLFQVDIKRHKKTVTIWLAIHERGVYELNHSTMDIEKTVLYENILSFGGYGDRLAIVSEGDRGADKLVYSLSIEKAAEIVNLMTEYIQATMAK